MFGTGYRRIGTLPRSNEGAIDCVAGVQQMKRNSKRLLEISTEQEITAFIPPDYAVRVAHERIGGMVEYFWQVVRGADFLTALDYVDRLAQSAYLQGVNDAALALIKAPESPKEKE
jgi:hypothetical protein